MSSHDLPESAGQHLRASDAERQAVMEQLEAAGFDGRLDGQELHDRIQAAQVATTRGELRELTVDLPGTGLSVPPARAVQPNAGAPIVAVFGGTERRSRWRPARRQSVLALFGGVRLDLRDAEFPADGLELRVSAVFGGIDILVPAGMRVEMTGFSLFGGRSVSGDTAGADTAGADTGLPTLRLHAVALFGGVDTKVAPPRAR